MEDQSKFRMHNSRHMIIKYTKNINPSTPNREYIRSTDSVGNNMKFWGHLQVLNIA